MASSSAEAQAPAHSGNAVTSFFGRAKSSPEWPYIMTDLIFKGSTALFYFFGNWFTTNFIILFVTDTVLIVVDFWFTKNIGGRRLTGMRWWHVPAPPGMEGTTWRFEHRGILEPDYKPSATATSQFWGGLFIMSVYWAIMAILTLQQPGFLIICVMGFLFAFTNINGYWKCKSWSGTRLSAEQQESLNVANAVGVGNVANAVAPSLVSGALQGGLPQAGLPQV